MDHKGYIYFMTNAYAGDYKPYLALVVGDGGMKAEDFLSMNPVDLFK